MTQQGVKIHARSSAGIFYGVETLRQLVEGEGTGAVLPEVEIHDWPSLAYRGTMVDISFSTSGGMVCDDREVNRRVSNSTWRAIVPDDVGPMIVALRSDEKSLRQWAVNVNPLCQPLLLHIWQ